MAAATTNFNNYILKSIFYNAIRQLTTEETQSVDALINELVERGYDKHLKIIMISMILDYYQGKDHEEIIEDILMQMTKIVIFNVDMQTEISGKDRTLEICKEYLLDRIKSIMIPDREKYINKISDSHINEEFHLRLLELLMNLEYHEENTFIKEYLNNL